MLQVFALPNVSVVVVGRPHYTYLTVADLMMKQPRSLIMITYGDAQLLLGEVRFIRKSKHRLPVLRAGERFLQHVADNRDGGL